MIPLHFRIPNPKFHMAIKNPKPKGIVTSRLCTSNCWLGVLPCCTVLRGTVASRSCSSSVIMFQLSKTKQDTPSTAFPGHAATTTYGTSARRQPTHLCCKRSTGGDHHRSGPSRDSLTSFTVVHGLGVGVGGGLWDAYFEGRLEHPASTPTAVCAGHDAHDTIHMLAQLWHHRKQLAVQLRPQTDLVPYIPMLPGSILK